MSQICKTQNGKNLQECENYYRLIKLL